MSKEAEFMERLKVSRKIMKAAEEKANSGLVPEQQKARITESRRYEEDDRPLEGLGLGRISEIAETPKIATVQDVLNSKLPEPVRSMKLKEAEEYEKLLAQVKKQEVSQEKRSPSKILTEELSKERKPQTSKEFDYKEFAKEILKETLKELSSGDNEVKFIINSKIFTCKILKIEEVK